MLTRSLDKAREAYRQGDAKASKAAHSLKRAPEQHQSSGQYMKSAVYGGLDGTITTFSVVAGVTGANLATSVILIMGFANLVGDGISMAIGDYLSTKAEREYRAAERKREQWEVEHFPDGEKQELVEIYTGKGMSRPDAEKMVSIIAKNKDTWVDIMMIEELGMLESNESPLRNAAVTFGSFCIFGLLPILAYVLSSLMPSLKQIDFPVAIGLTAATLFSLGALKTRFTGRRWYVSGMEMMLVGGLAASAAYLIGCVLGGI